MNCAALFVRRDSIYKTIDGVDCYDIDRNALNYKDSMPVIAHPSCRAWGMFSNLAKPRIGEKDLARWAVRKIRHVGGVLEHPKGSKLWKDMGLPGIDWLPDEYGGYTLEIDQCRWGHKARKRTYLYIVGSKTTPPIPEYRLPTHQFYGRTQVKSGIKPLPELPKSDREKTPPDFAIWLVQLAIMCTNTPK